MTGHVYHKAWHYHGSALKVEDCPPVVIGWGHKPREAHRLAKGIWKATQAQKTRCRALQDAQRLFS